MELIRKLHHKTKQYVRLVLTGFAMGTADLIPGVSGGTIAFLSGIYEELLYSIKIVTGEVLQLVLKGQIVKAWKAIPFGFLIPLVLGLFAAILTLANVLSYLLDTYPVFVWAFFFGLVLASVWVVLKRVVKWDVSDKISFVVSAVVAYIVVGAVPVETPNNLIFIFFSGMIAICAMILPGISGSFILLLLGKYSQILDAVTNRDILTLIVFMGGAIVGLALFARLLSWLFSKHHDISIAILAGFMLGSIRKLWPWKEVVETRVNSHGEIVPLVERNIFPHTFDLSVVFAVLLAVIGAVGIIYLYKAQLTREQTKDLEDKEFNKEHVHSLKDQ